MDTRNNELPVWTGKLEAANAVMERAEKIWEAPVENNEKCLFDILEASKDTEYGKEYDFASIKSIEDFREKIPVTTYDDYQDYIIRMTENGEKNLITASEVNHYNKTSGTTGTPKRIPAPQWNLKMTGDYISNYQYALAERYLGREWTSGRCFQIATMTSSVMPTLPCGATYGAISGMLLIQYKPVLEKIYPSPVEAIFIEPDTDYKYLHALFAMLDKDITCISSSFFSFVVDQFRYIRKNWEIILDDMEKGTINPEIKMSKTVRDSVSRKFTANPERAAELRKVFENGGQDTKFIKKIWPKMTMIFGIGTGSFLRYVEIVKNEFIDDSIAIIRTGLNASEGALTCPYALDTEDTVLIPESMYYEFLPIECEDDFSEVVGIGEVEVGKKYELIITTYGGFYRYRMKDVVEITGKYSNTPTVRYCYRRDDVISIMGEKTTVVALGEAVEKTAEELNVSIVDFSAFPDLEAQPVRYDFFIELDYRVERNAMTFANVSLKEFRVELEKQLAIANPSLGEKMAREICGHIKIFFLDEDAYFIYKELQILKGTSPSQIKPVHIIRNDKQKLFFLGLTDCSTENYI